MIRGDYNGQLMYPLYDPSHACQWYYMSRQGVEDVLLFKSFDSKEGSIKCKWYLIEIAKQGQPQGSTMSLTKSFCIIDVPHTSFSLPDVPDDAPSRISVEVRALVFTR